MARLIRYTGSLRGVRRVRASSEVDATLERRAEQVADAARNTYAALGYDIHVVVALETGTDIVNGKHGPSARAAVFAGGPSLPIEAKHRVLGGSLDAARG